MKESEIVLQILLKSVETGTDVFDRIGVRESDETFSIRAEIGSRCHSNMGFLQNVEGKFVGVGCVFAGISKNIKSALRLSVNNKT